MISQCETGTERCPFCFGKEKGMEIIEKNIGELIPYEHNPRKNDDAVEAVANSIREFGFKVPVVVDKDNVVVAGHTRIKAARELGIDQIPCIVADDLTDEQIKAYRLADNKVAELADWDFTLMDEQLAEITEIDMSQFGFDIDALEPEPEVEEVDVPEDVETRCKPGDVWALGDHRLMCGDSSKTDDLDILMGGGVRRYVLYRPALWCFDRRQKQSAELGSESGTHTRKHTERHP